MASSVKQADSQQNQSEGKFDTSIASKDPIVIVDTTNNKSEENKLNEGGETCLTDRQEFQNKYLTISSFAIPEEQAPFLVGSRGRNLALIREYTGMVIQLKKDGKVEMTKSSLHSDPHAAYCMALSSSYGGIIHWFKTRRATEKGYPREKEAELQSIASTFQCTLQLLRSRQGHMCLILIPNIVNMEMFGNKGWNDNLYQKQLVLPSQGEEVEWREKIQSARVALFQALTTSSDK